MPRPIRLNAFDVNCVAHQSPGLWRHPGDRAWDYRKLCYRTDLAQLLERGRFDGLFIADALGIYDVCGRNRDATARHATQVQARLRQSESEGQRRTLDLHGGSREALEIEELALSGGRAGTAVPFAVGAGR